MLKIAVFAPIPSASVATTMTENDGFFKSERTANLSSWRKLSMRCLRGRSPAMARG